MTSDDLELGMSLSPNPDEVGDSPEIWMDDGVRKRIAEFALTDTSRELGGVLLGELITDGPRPKVRVLAEIQAKHTEAVQTSVKFTHATWEDINKQRDEKYPDMKMVGWFHTHPGFGIFLSHWDLFIHRNFFNLPWQVAYVVDPKAKESGFFRWENGEVVKTTGEAKPMPKPQPEPTLEPQPVVEKLQPVILTLPPEEEQAIAGRNRLRWTVYAMGAANVILLALVGWMLWGRPKPPVEVAAVPPATTAKPAPTPTPTPTPAATPTPTPKPPVASKAPKPAKPVQQDLFESYNVQRGDSYWAIAQRRYGNGNLYPAIQAADPTPGLRAGEQIRVPSKEVAEVVVRALKYRGRR